MALRADIQIVFQDPFASLDPRMRVGEILQEGVAALLPHLSQSVRHEKVAKRIGARGFAP